MFQERSEAYGFYLRNDLRVCQSSLETNDPDNPAHSDTAPRTRLLQVIELGSCVRLVLERHEPRKVGVVRAQPEPGVRIRVATRVHVVRKMNVLKGRRRDIDISQTLSVSENWDVD